MGATDNIYTGKSTFMVELMVNAVLSFTTRPITNISSRRRIRVNHAKEMSAASMLAPTHIPVSVTAVFLAPHLYIASR